MELLERRCLAIRVPDFYPEGLAALIADRLESAREVSPYPLANDARAIERWGLVFLGDDAIESQRYRSEARLAIEAQRALCHPYLSPTDLFRLRLEEAWPMGATLERFGARPMSIGFARLFRSGATAKPHVDDVRWAIAECPRAASIRAQLAANIYLAVPPTGGELRLWALEPSADEYRWLRALSSYGLDYDKLPEPTVEIRPVPGELILFRSTCVHAVNAASGCRISFGCSISYYGPDLPLGYWS